MTALNAIGAVVGVGQSVAIAYFFGASRQVEIFFAAVAVEASILHMTQTGQLTEIFLPVYHRIKHEKGNGQAHACFAVMVNILVLSVIGLAAAMYFAAPLLVRLRVPGFSLEDLLTTTALFRAMLPLLIIHVASAMLKTLANAEKWFGMPEAIGIGSRILGVIVLIASVSSWGVWALVAGMYVNNVIAVAALGLLAVRFGYRHRLSLWQPGFRPLPLLKQLATTFFYVIATQTYAFAFDAGLSQLPQGVFAVFKYVQQHLVGKTMGLLLRPVNVVFYTHAAEALAKGTQGVVALTKRALDLTLAGWVLVVVTFVAAGRPLLQGLWGGEKFTSDEIDLAAHFACWLYALLIVTATGQIYRRLAMSLGYVRGYYICSSAIQLGCGLLAMVLLPGAGLPGAFAVIAANMIGLAIMPVILVAVMRRDLIASYSLLEIFRWSVSAGLGIAAAVLCGHFFLSEPTAHDRAIELSTAALLGGIASAGTLISAWLLGIAEVRQGLSKLRLAISHAFSAGHG